MQHLGAIIWLPNFYGLIKVLETPALFLSLLYKFMRFYQRPMKTCACTVATKSYLAYARTLMNSIKKVHPEWDLYVLLVDEIDGCFDPNDENFSIINISEIELPDYWSFLFRYNAFELLMATKPWIIDSLFKKGYESVFYFDSDICVYKKLTEAQNLLKDHFMVLTPHILKSLDGDGKSPSDMGILEVGAYNMGFLALRKHDELRRFLQWWKGKLEFNCVIQKDRHLFVDQRCMDLAPSLFSNVAILRHNGYNTAYYNIMDRNAADLVFFHFSGIKMNASDQEFASFSYHQNRFTVDSLKTEFKEIVIGYKNELLKNGLEKSSKWPYAFGKFSNGVEIDDIFRRIYRENPTEVGLNPFVNCNFFKNDSLFLKTELDYFGFFESEKSSDGSVWVSNHAIIRLPPSSITLEISGVCDAFNRKNFSIELSINGKSLGNFPVAHGRFKIRTKLPLNKEESILTIQPNSYFVPALIGINDDPRKLSFKIINVHLNGRLFMDFSKDTPLIKNKKVNFGVNLVGFANAEHSIGQSLRNSANTLQATNIDFNIVKVNDPSRRGDDFSFDHKIAKTNSHYVNLFHINGCNFLDSLFHPDFFINRYNIAFWHWETMDVPDFWFEKNKMLNEIWVPSQFVLKNVTNKAKIPVTLVPHSVDFKIEGYGREYFGLPKDKFIFLVMYDMFSTNERKNPFAAIKAFSKAFPNSKDVVLVIKTYGDNHTLTKKLEEVKRSLCPNSILINQMLTRQEVYELENVCDCYVSLHRAEGFGLNIAESMFLGKPVIVTNWSGNVDFNNSKNSCLVDYSWMELDKDYELYPKGTIWAEADVDHASWYMKELYENARMREKLGKNGQKTILENYSPKVVGEIYKNRLAVIGGP